MNTDKTIRDLSLAEKVRLLAGASMWETEAVERCGVPAIVVTDGPHGVRLGNFETQETNPATAFPVEAAMAATWNEELIRSCGEVMAEECQHYGVSVLLGPGVNGKRSPLGGRNFEYYSEDPYLTGRVAIAFVRGVQSGGVGTSVKHFVANEQEKNRMVVSSRVDERALREIYLRPFEMVVEQADPWTVMCSYNRLNGVRMANNDRLLNGVLRDEWGYDGLVMSDWGAVFEKVASVKNGLDLEMPGPGKRNDEVLAAIERGEISEAQVDDHVRRLLRLIERAHEGRRRVESIDFDAHHAFAASVAEESVVLLKNEDDALPLERGMQVAVLGAFAESPRIQGGGSSHMNPSRLAIPREAIATYADVVYRTGYSGEQSDEALVHEAVEAARGADAAIVFVGTTDRIECEGYDRTDLGLPESHVRLIQAIAEVNRRLIVVNHSGSAVDLTMIEPAAKAILHAWLPGQAGGEAIARILFGEICPSGKLSETFPLALEHNPSYLNFPGNVESVEYSESVFVGYRHYDARKLPVAYPFGYGLSYTSFAYSDLSLSCDTLSHGESLVVRFRVGNTGSRRGKEVVQLYVGDPESTVRRPVRELKGFAKVDLEPGESTGVELELDERAFAYYVDHLGRFAVESGEFVIEVGASSRSIRLSQRVRFVSTDEVRPPLDERNDLGEYLSDDRYRDALLPHYDVIVASSNDNPLLPSLLGMPAPMALDFLPHFGASTESVGRLRQEVERVRSSSP